MQRKAGFSRREFMKRSATVGALLAFPAVIPASALGAAGRPSPSNRITMGAIGVGGQGGGNLGGFLGDNRIQVVAVCDVDRRHVEEHEEPRQRPIPATRTARPTRISARWRPAMTSTRSPMATPDHWHALTVIACAKGGKDIYGEKPFSHDLREGRAMVNDAQAVWARSGRPARGSARRAISAAPASWCANGYIGKVHTVEVGLPTGGPGGRAPFKAPPAESGLRLLVRARAVRPLLE